MNKTCMGHVISGKIATVFIIIVAVSCLNSTGNKKVNDPKDYDLRGKVKSVSVKAFSDENQKFTGEYHLFDRDGKQLEERYLINDSVITTRVVYRYDGYGCLAEIKYMDHEGFIDARTIYKYDENRNLYQKLDLNHLSNLAYRETYKYDRRHFEIERYIYRPPHSEWNIEYIVDDEGNLKKESYNKNISGFLMKIVYLNDNKGNKIEEQYLKKDGSIGTRITYKYDRKGNILQTITFNSSGEIITSSFFTYDEDLRKVEKRSVLSESGSLPDQILSYDGNGNIIESINNTPLGQVRVVNNYIYDEKGNWVKKESAKFIAGKEKAVNRSNTLRIIEYY